MLLGLGLTLLVGIGLFAFAGELPVTSPAACVWAAAAGSSVPEAGALCLFGLGFLGVGGLKWRKKLTPGVGGRGEAEVAGDYRKLRPPWGKVIPNYRTRAAGFPLRRPLMNRDCLSGVPG